MESLPPGGDAGLCIADSCQADHAICDVGDGFHCVYNDAEQYTCAKDGTPVTCAHTTTNGSSAGAGVLAMVGLLALGRRRRA